MDFLKTAWDLAWTLFAVFAFIVYLMTVLAIIGDLVRDRRLNGWVKAVWVVCLIALPFVTALAYLVFRGRGMADRTYEQHRAVEAATADYVRSVANAGPAEEIATAKHLLDAEAISRAEFDRLKAQALTRVA